MECDAAGPRGGTARVSVRPSCDVRREGDDGDSDGGGGGEDDGCGGDDGDGDRDGGGANPPPYPSFPLCLSLACKRVRHSGFALLPAKKPFEEADVRNFFASNFDPRSAAPALP